VRTSINLPLTVRSLDGRYTAHSGLYMGAGSTSKSIYDTYLEYKLEVYGVRHPRVIPPQESEIVTCKLWRWKSTLCGEFRAFTSGM